jgi:hypothetical protein
MRPHSLAGDGVEIHSMRLQQGAYSTIGVLHYAEQGIDVEYGICLDFDKAAFLDRSSNTATNLFFKRHKARIVDASRTELLKVRHAALGLAGVLAEKPAREDNNLRLSSD